MALPGVREPTMLGIITNKTAAGRRNALGYNGCQPAVMPDQTGKMMHGRDASRADIEAGRLRRP
jgi:hypothetical protein